MTNEATDILLLDINLPGTNGMDAIPIILSKYPNVSIVMNTIKDDVDTIYKCLELGIKVNDLKGDNSVDHSVRWISQSYGHLIRSKRYKDAFHFHNTGRVVPLIGRYLTHDKTYIPRGIRYMEYFSKN